MSASPPAIAPASAGAPAPAARQRSTGELALVYAVRGGRTVPARVYRAGAARFFQPGPRTAPAEGVIINTAGGITGGDRMATTVTVGEGAEATLTTQAAEKVYRAAAGDPPADVTTSLTLSPAADLSWLPQPTILFDRARLARRLDADLAPDARLIALESVILGRRAMGERVTAGFFLDRWRIRRAGALLFADATRLSDDLANVWAGRATLAGAGAFALLVMVGPDAADRLAGVRRAIEGAPVTGGASAFNGLLAVRLLAPDGARLVSALAGVVAVLRPAGLPRMWSI